MQYIRKIALSILGIILLASLVGLAISLTINRTIRDKEVVKTWLDQSGVYDSVADSLIEQMKKDSQSNVPEDIGISNSELQPIIDDAFQPELVRDVAEDIVDATYTWLETDDSSTTTSIDLSEAKSKIAGNLAAYTATRIEALPICTPSQIRALSSSPDLFAINCKPPEFNSAQAKIQIEENVLSNLNSSMPDSYTDSTLTPGEEQGSLMNQVKHLYRTTGWVPYVFSIMILLCSPAIVLIGSTRKKGLFVFAGILLSTGVSLGLISIILYFVPQTIVGILDSRRANIGAAGELLTIASQSTGTLLWWFIVPYLLTGLGLFAYTKSVTDINIDNNLPLL